jgi:hypothetical protein
MRITRRKFNKGLAGTFAAASAPSLLPQPAKAAPYRGPNVIIVRFGGGVRRVETIEERTSFAPYFLNELAKRGVLIDQLKGGDTSHAEGTRGWAGAAISSVLLVAVWFGLIAQLYVAQFANHAWWNWINHPIIGLPWIFRPLGN